MITLRKMLLGSALVLVCLGAPTQSLSAPKRVVSLNLCTDELLLFLADATQIASLTWLVKDPTLSWLAQEARAFPSNRGLAEEILVLKPDLVLAGTFSPPTTVALLKRMNIQLLQVPAPSTPAEIEQQMRRVAQSLGRSAAAESLISRMRRDLAALPALPESAARLSAALYEPNGLTATQDTLVHAALRQAGFENLAVSRRLPRYARLPLETLVYDQPDVLVLNEYDIDTPSLAQSLMRHPALRAAFQSGRRVVVPAQAWSCGTPHYVHAVQILRRAALELTTQRVQTG